MAIWFDKTLTVDRIRPDHLFDNTATDLLGLEYTELGEDYLRGTLPVDERTKQPYGILHGGMSCVLAESLGSVAGNLVLDPATHRAVGAEINASHLRPASSGIVTGTARPIKLGRQLQVWEIKIENEAGKLVCISRLTMAVVPR